MNPLIEKYFSGELTEPEESALEELLTKSLESAWEFGQTAEAIYKRYGLPELPDPPFQKQGRAKGPWKWWVFSTLLLLLLSGLMAWRFLHLPPAAPAKEPAPETPVEKKTPARPTEKPKPKPQPAARPTAVPTPPPSGSPEKETGNNLRVVVKRSSPGTATVKVVNSSGTPIRLLYSGNLGTGDWAFEWDGQDGNGRLVGPGQYRIEVLTEGVTQSREVVIH